MKRPITLSYKAPLMSRTIEDKVYGNTFRTTVELMMKEGTLRFVYTPDEPMEVNLGLHKWITNEVTQISMPDTCTDTSAMSFRFQTLSGEEVNIRIVEAV